MPTRNDGYRILVDRLWPRGVKKENAKIDEWIKDIAPPKELVMWFHQDKEARFKEFSKKYRSYLKNASELPKTNLLNHETLTLVTAVKDVDHSHIPTLKNFLENVATLSKEG